MGGGGGRRGRGRRRGKVVSGEKEVVEVEYGGWQKRERVG